MRKRQLANAAGVASDTLNPIFTFRQQNIDFFWKEVKSTIESSWGRQKKNAFQKSTTNSN